MKNCRRTELQTKETASAKTLRLHEIRKCVCGTGKPVWLEQSEQGYRGWRGEQRPDHEKSYRPFQVCMLGVYILSNITCIFLLEEADAKLTCLVNEQVDARTQISWICKNLVCFLPHRTAIPWHCPTSKQSETTLCRNARHLSLESAFLPLSVHACFPLMKPSSLTSCGSSCSFFGMKFRSPFHLRSLASLAPLPRLEARP